jgi:hypothetical protein
MFEVMVIENNQVNGTAAVWSECFQTSSERAHYIIDVIAQEAAFNSRFGHGAAFISFLKCDTRDAVPVRIQEVRL